MSTTHYQVLVRNASGGLFVASVLGVAGCVAEGRTRDEAVEKARTVLVEQLAHGEIVTIDIERTGVEVDAVEPLDKQASKSVWREEARRFRDDPTFDQFLLEIDAARRRETGEPA